MNVRAEIRDESKRARQVRVEMRVDESERVKCWKIIKSVKLTHIYLPTDITF